MKSIKAITLHPLKVESVLDEIEALQRRIAVRAHDLFMERGGEHGRDLDDWLAAEADLAVKPPIEIVETEKELVIRAALPGFEPKEIQVSVTPNQLLIQAGALEDRAQEHGQVYFSELRIGNIFRSIALPRRVDPEHVVAELKNGILSIRAALAGEQPAARVHVAEA
jgi:HSP20 family protein